MENDNSKITGLRSLLDYNMENITSAEAHLTTHLNQWISQAKSVKFKIILQKYLEFINLHLQKLNVFAEEEKIISLSTTNRVMEAFVDDTNSQLDNCMNADVKDACLLACIQNINHYKISIYGTAAAMAEKLEMHDAVSVFREAEMNEKQIDDRLSQLAIYEINANAQVAVI